MKRTGRFFLLLVFITIIMATVWQMIFPERIYDCRDMNLLGYLAPGDWIHGEYEHVDAITDIGDMSKPDALLKGWSIGKLWLVWSAMFGSSIVVSWMLSNVRLGPEFQHTESKQSA